MVSWYKEAYYLDDHIYHQKLPHVSLVHKNWAENSCDSVYMSFNASDVTSRLPLR